MEALWPTLDVRSPRREEAVPHPTDPFPFTENVAHPPLGDLCSPGQLDHVREPMVFSPATGDGGPRAG